MEPIFFLFQVAKRVLFLKHMVRQRKPRFVMPVSGMAVCSTAMHKRCSSALTGDCLWGQVAWTSEHYPGLTVVFSEIEPDLPSVLLRLWQFEVFCMVPILQNYDKFECKIEGISPRNEECRMAPHEGNTPLPSCGVRGGPVIQVEVARAPAAGVTE